MDENDDLIQKLKHGALDNVLAGLYGISAVDEQRTRYVEAIGTFSEHFGVLKNLALFSAPGRTEIGGNHTDHQHGMVLAASVTLDMIAVAALRKGTLARVKSEGYPLVEIDLRELEPAPAEKETPTALIRGIAARLGQRGHSVRGFDVYVHSAVPVGSGLSSSAAFEVLLGNVMNGLFPGEPESALELAIAGRYAENVFFGKPCGLMDQAACSVGGVQYMNFADVDNPVVQAIPFDLAKAGYGLCIIHSGADHANLADIYASIPEEMCAVAAIFGKNYLAELDKQSFLARFADVRRLVGDRAALRALHFIEDTARVPLEAAALHEGRFADFLNLVNESGRSSADLLQNIIIPGASSKQELAVALALCKEFLDGKGACRVHGGGFGGTAQAFVPLERIDSFKKNIDSILGDGRCMALSIRQAGGTRLA